jgi:hypothetical protein
VRESEISNLRQRTLKIKIQLFILTKNLTKQLALVAKSIFKFSDSQRNTLRGWVITYIRVRVGVRDVLRQLAQEAKAGEVARLALGPLILLGAGGINAGEVKVTEDCTHLGHHLLELLLLLVPEAVLLLSLALVAGVILVVVVVLLEESNFFLLGQSEMKWVVSPHSKQPLGDLLRSLQNLCRAQNFLASRAISSSGMLSYCSSEATPKEDKANSNADELVVLVGLATWPPTRAPVIKALPDKEAS